MADFEGGGFTNLSDGLLSGGHYVVGGTLEYGGAGGLIRTIGASTSITLDGQNGGAASILSGSTAAGFGNALVALAENDGVLNVINRAAAIVGGAFTNTGRLGIGGGLFTASGHFSNRGGVVVIDPNGVLTINGSDFCLWRPSDFDGYTAGVPVDALVESNR